MPSTTFSVGPVRKNSRKSSQLPAGYSFKWAGEHEFELRAKERLQVILPVVFFVNVVLLYMVFHSVAESAVLIFPTLYALTGGLILQKVLGYNFSVAVWADRCAMKTSRKRSLKEPCTAYGPSS